jgi:hypothetical protein
MSQNKNQAFPLGSILYNLFAIPCNLIIGFVIGVTAPVVAIAAMVAGIRLITGKVPFPTPIQGEGDERRLSLELVPPEQASELFSEQKEKIGADFGKLQAEIKAMVEEAKAEAQAKGEAAPEEA